MRTTNKNGKIITDFETWRSAFIEVDEPIHWKPGRSAYSLACHFTNPSYEMSDGIVLIKKWIEQCSMKEGECFHARIEHESKFDSFRNGRIQDMVIWGKAKNPFVVCIEAKVDEKFNETISEAYAKAKIILEQKPKSKAKERIEDLWKRFYGNRVIDINNNIRYQLVYYLAGSLTEAKTVNGDLYMPVLVYHTDKFDDKKGNLNHKDYITFMESLDFVKHKAGDFEIYKNTIEGINVYSSYIEIPLCLD
ncbi:MAG: hypothetical protein MJZ28_10915 [Paludibacteraceae bacterium]|nr:hypothetical protein [Paludibacteraceae bacterium]